MIESAKVQKCNYHIPHVIMVLAKSAENRNRMKEFANRILPPLSIEETRQEKVCVKKRRDLLNNGVTTAQLKVRN